MPLPASAASLSLCLAANASFRRAYSWYSAAALEGNADSLQCLADMTRLGQGVAASEVQAAELQRAADELRKAQSD